MRAREQGANAEQDKYNAAILKRADELDRITAEALLEMRLGKEAGKEADGEADGEADNGAGYTLGLENRDREVEENSKELQRAYSLLPTLLTSKDKPIIENNSSVSYLQFASNRELL